MKAFKAIFAGVMAGLVMTGLGWLARAGGLDLNGEMMLGTLLGYPPSQDTWLIGLGVHLILSAFIALLYAAAFEAIAHRAGAAAGFSFSVVHTLIAGLAMAAIPSIHPLIPEQMPAPGAFLMNMGAPNVVLFVTEHLLFGTLVGAIYGTVRHPWPQAAVAA